MAYEIRRKEKESSLPRQALNVGLRALTALPSLGGQALNALQSLAGGAVNLGSRALGYPDMPEMPSVRFGPLPGGGYGPMPNRREAPTTEYALERLGQATGSPEYFKPQSSGEEIAYELATRLPQSIALGGKLGSTMAQSVAPSVAGVAAKKVAKEAGLSPETQTAIDIGTDFLTGAVMRGALPRNVGKFAKSLLNEADEIIFKDYKNVWHTIDKIKPAIQKAERFLEEGLSAESLPSKKQISSILRDLRNQMEYEKLTPSQFRRFWKDLNEADSILRGSPEGYAIAGELRAGIKESLKDYARTNPKFAEVEKSLSLGTDTLRAIHSLKPDEIISVLREGKLIPAKLSKGVFKMALEQFATAPSALKMALTDKGTRNYYMNILKKAGTGSIPAAIQQAENQPAPKRFLIRKKQSQPS